MPVDLEEASHVDVGHIVFTGPVESAYIGTEVPIVLGALSTPTQQSPACRDFGGIDASVLGAKGVFAGACYGSIHGSISAGQISDVRTIGVIGGADPITIESTINAAGTYSFEIRASEFGGNVTIKSRSQRINRVEAPGPILATVISTHGTIGSVIGGEMITGDILAEMGSIDDITAGWNIGTPGNPITIRVRSDALDSVSLGRIEARDRIFANITTDHMPPGMTRANSNLGSIVTTGPIGSFCGTISTASLVGSGVDPFGIDLVSDFEGNSLFKTNVEEPILIKRLIGGEVVNGVMTIGAVLNIGQRLTSAGSIEIADAGGLAGQVIIQNEQGDAAPWAGPVVIGPPGNQIILTDEFYTTRSADLGGGAVGVAPFGIHYEDCVPNEDAGRVLIPDSETTGVVIEHYGPVKDKDTDPHLLSVTMGGSDMTSHFDIFIDPGNPRRVVLLNVDAMPGDYTVRNVEGTDDLVSDEVGASPSGVCRRYPFHFTLVDDCNTNQIGDDVDVAEHPELHDCDNDNGVVDVCEEHFTDCNCNQLPDCYDIAMNPDLDADQNGVLDCIDPLNLDPVLDEMRCDCSDCPCDWNSDGFLNDTDFFDWVNDFFNQSGPHAGFDFNGDGFENDQDWFDFNNCFFSPPQGCV